MMEANKNDEILKTVNRITLFGAVINLMLSVLKLAGGILGHSQVLIADAVHSLSDLVTDAAVLMGARYWKLPADENHPYGHAKIETLVTFFIGFMLVLVGGKLMMDAILILPGFWQAKNTVMSEAPTVLALLAAIISIIVKEFLYIITVRAGQRIHSSAVIANAWHHRSDAMSSIPAALAVGCCLLFGPAYSFLDSVGTIIVGVMILQAAWKIIYPTFHILLDAGASEEKVKKIQEIVLKCPGVRHPHKIRTRYLGSQSMEVDLHVWVDPEMTVKESHVLSHMIESELHQSELGIVDVFVHVEPTSSEKEVDHEKPMENISRK
ncbi:MAG: cation diffusion facilitator family transporter [Planctomycetia bacterium]|nr:cation diffusion facilitator family transporter [Planctomycetia bacterium]